MTAMVTAALGTHNDVVIVGGRVAGALTAAHLAALGQQVTVLESSALTSGTTSTHFFRGDGLVRGLWNVGLLDEVLATGAPPLTCEYSYFDGGATPSVDPPQEPAEFGYCLSVRRETLDPLMAAGIAAIPGVRWLNHRRVVGLIGSHPVRGVVDSEGAEHHAPVVVGGTAVAPPWPGSWQPPRSSSIPLRGFCSTATSPGTSARVASPDRSSLCAETKWPTPSPVTMASLAWR